MTNWISVKERLPENEGYYLGAIKRSWTDYLIDKVKYVTFNDGIKRFSFCLGYRGSEVTHWMPLPEPPEK